MKPRTFELTLPSAQTLAELTSRYEDLTFAARVLGRLVALLESGSQDGDLARAYWHAAVSAYARAFVEGTLRQHSASAVASVVTDNLRTEHDSLIKRRNVEVAHAVDQAFDDVVVGVTVTNYGASVKTDYGIRQTKVFAPLVDEVRRIRVHVAQVAEALERVAKERQKELVSQADAALARGEVIWDRDVTALFADPLAPPANGIGLSLRVVSHEEVHSMRAASGRNPSTNLTKKRR